MKNLSVNTVRKALLKMGFCDCPNGYPHPDSELHMGFLDGLHAAMLCVKWTPMTGNIEFSDARWNEAPNVHVVSYFGFPRTGAELNKMLSEVRRIYGALCGITFREDS